MTKDDYTILITGYDIDGQMFITGTWYDLAFFGGNIPAVGDRIELEDGVTYFEVIQRYFHFNKMARLIVQERPFTRVDMNMLNK